MLENTGSAKGAAKGYGRNMPQLNLSQNKMRHAFLETYIRQRRSRTDTSEFCFICDKPGDNRENGSMFSTVIPSTINSRSRYQLVMDNIYGIWVCTCCTKKMEDKS